VRKDPPRVQRLLSRARFSSFLPKGFTGKESKEFHSVIYPLYQNPDSLLSGYPITTKARY